MRIYGFGVGIVALLVGVLITAIPNASPSGSAVLVLDDAPAVAPVGSIDIVSDKDVYVCLHECTAYVSVTNNLADIAAKSVSLTADFEGRGIPYTIYEAKNVPYDVAVYEDKFVPQTCTTTDNETLETKEYDCGYWEQVQTDTVTEYKTEWVPFDGSNYDFVKGATKQYRIDFTVPIGSSGKWSFNVAADVGTFSLDPWWDSDWTYKRSITINNTDTRSHLGEYVTALINHGGHADSTCKDVRVLNDSGQTVTNYEILLKNSTHCRIGFLTGNISAQSAVTYNIYYGNPDASDASVEVTHYNSDFSNCSLTTKQWTFHSDGTSTIECVIAGGRPTIHMYHTASSHYPYMWLGNKSNPSYYNGTQRNGGWVFTAVMNTTWSSIRPMDLFYRNNTRDDNDCAGCGDDSLLHIFFYNNGWYFINDTEAEATTSTQFSGGNMLLGLGKIYAEQVGIDSFLSTYFWRILNDTAEIERTVSASPGLNGSKYDTVMLPFISNFGGEVYHFYIYNVSVRTFGYRYYDVGSGITVGDEETDTGNYTSTLSQSVSPDSPQYINTTIDFSCDYRHNNTPISGGNCYVRIDTDAHTATYGDEIYTYTNNTMGTGTHTWYCNCSHDTYDGKQHPSENFTILSDTDVSNAATFYGNANANASSIVTAWIEGVQSGSFTIATDGEYGMLDVFGDATLVYEGKTVVFKIDGVNATQTATWHSGSTTRLDLTMP